MVWSWDITKLKGPRRGEYYDLYVVLDIFSRYVVAWCVAPTEDGELAKELIADAVARHRVPPGQLTIHADRGSSMTSNPVAELLTFLGIGRTHSRPHVSNDNPYSEAQFKTLKYCPAFPERFGSIEDARAFCETFFAYYNHDHRHSGIGYHTPASVHYGTAEEVRAQRAETLEAAYAANPARFRHRTTRTAEAPHRRLDQRARETEEAHTEGVVRTCLKSLDRFRPEQTRQVGAANLQEGQTERTLHSRTRECLFCESTESLTGEPIFPWQLRQLGFTGDGWGEDVDEPNEPGRRIEKGSPFDKKAKMVCAAT